MSWHLAPALAQLRAEVNKRWPKRSKRSDGTIGDAAHSARRSDHNPNSRRSVNAIDITASGIDTGALIAAAKKHPSVRYIIHRGQIMNRDIGNFRARRYTGSNPHNTHVHISIYQSRTAEQRRQSWGIATAKAPAGGTSTGGRYREVKYGDLLKLYTKGAPVREWQRTALGYTGKKADGYFGPSTEADTKRFQREHGVTADGVVGPTTWPLRLGKKSQPKPAPKPKTNKRPAAPKFPLPKGWYFGPRSGPKRSVSGYHGGRNHLKVWQSQMRGRGWKITADGLYGPQTQRVARAFQKEKRLSVDGLIGKSTWTAAWEAPVT